MANNNNLKPFTKETAKENGRKGGIASGIKRNQNKDFLELLVKIGHQQIDDQEARTELKKMGLDTDVRNFVICKLIERAKTGDTKAIIKLFDTLAIADTKDSYKYDLDGNYKE